MLEFFSDLSIVLIIASIFGLILGAFCFIMEKFINVDKITTWLYGETISSEDDDDFED